ncbi:MAG: response regulator [Gammaproteobacteria bacterium]
MDITGLNPKQGKANKSSPKVLIIENSQTEIDFLTMILEKRGYQTICALSGEEGLRLANNENPDVILLGILLPGINGWDVLRRLRLKPETGNFPVIVVSIGNEKKKGLALGANDYISKPINEKQLLVALKKVLNIKQPQTILIIDDDKLSRSFIKNLMCPSSCQVLEAENGLAALKILDQIEPDLILLDLLMPVMDGFEFLENLQSKSPPNNIPVVVISAKTLTDEDYKKMDVGVLKIIDKNKMDTKIEAQYLTQILDEDIPERRRKRRK